MAPKNDTCFPSEMIGEASLEQLKSTLYQNLICGRGSKFPLTQQMTLQIFPLNTLTGTVKTLTAVTLHCYTSQLKRGL